MAVADSSLREEVTRFYSEKRVATGYESQRYAGTSGELVARRELAIVAELLPATGTILDVACGTGRLGAALGSTRQFVGVDASPAMLAQTRRSGRYELALADAFSLPFADRSFDATVALRLLFHFPDPEPILRELVRVTRTGGAVVFETASFSPRASRALDSARWGPQVFVHSRARVQSWLDGCQVDIANRVDAFLVSPVLYRGLPPFGGFLLQRLESLVPSGWRCRTYWRAQLAPESRSATAELAAAG